jgi:hypothetical protein
VEGPWLMMEARIWKENGLAGRGCAKIMVDVVQRLWKDGGCC